MHIKFLPRKEDIDIELYKKKHGKGILVLTFFATSPIKLF